MKVLIWIGCFLVASILNTILGYATGIKAGYLVFYFAVYFVAKKLCNKWDERKSIKKATETKPKDTITTENKCEMCGHVCDKTTAAKIEDDMGVRYRNLCDACMEIYNTTPNEPTDLAESVESKIEEPVSSAAQIQFCRKCGEKLMGNSRFCRKCGTEIVKE
jgi:ribosomal protein L40E